MLRLLLLVAALLMPAPALAKFASDRITVTAEGKGPDVILLHGLGSNKRVWQGTVAAVPGYRYHLVQVRGFGGEPNAGNTADPVVVPLADEIARYIREEKLSKPAFVGHSMGGTVGMTLASRHPQAIGRLMVVDMLPFIGAMFGGPTATPASLAPVADGIAVQMRKAPKEQADAMQRQTIVGMINTGSEREAAIAEGLASDRDLSTRAFRELIVTDMRPDLAKVTVPLTVLYVTPKGAPITDAQMDGFYAASYAGAKGAKLVRIPNSAHFIMFDAADRFRSELKTFLAAK